MAVKGSVELVNVSRVCSFTASVGSVRARFEAGASLSVIAEGDETVNAAAAPVIAANGAAAASAAQVDAANERALATLASQPSRFRRVLAYITEHPIPIIFGLLFLLGACIATGGAFLLVPPALFALHLMLYELSTKYYYQYSCCQWYRDLTQLMGGDEITPPPRPAAS